MICIQFDILQKHLTLQHDYHQEVFLSRFIVFLIVSFFPFCLFSQISISSARSLGPGSYVTVSGIVTVANELGGPSYIQDETAGIAIYDLNFHSAVEIGDSVVVSGTMTDYSPKSGVSGSGLLEISGAGITFQVFKNPSKKIDPKVIAVSQIGESFEGQLVEIKNVTIGSAGNFKGNTNYTFSDATGTLVSGLRIDKDVTGLVGAAIPLIPTDIICVVSQYQGDYQLLPRSAADMKIKPKTVPYENIPIDSTFDIVTWNCEWLGYGAGSYGPSDDDLQVQNVIKVFRKISADVYGIQEMSNTASFQTILDSLPEYGGYYAPFGQTQKTAFLYKKQTVTPVSHDFLFTTGDWASGRYPYEFVFDYIQNGKSNRIHAINIHAKATTTNPPNDYARRVTDMAQLKPYFDTNRETDKLMLLGDYNDDLDVSVVGGNVSPYAAFVSDVANYKPISKFFSDNGIGTHSGGSTLDHMIVSNELAVSYLDSTIRLENISFIPGYLSTTSDHYPVSARFKFSGGASVSVNNRNDLPETFLIYGNYPNPFNPTTKLSFSIPENGNVDITVFNLLGQKVGSIFWSNLNRGYHEIPFDGSKLSSGIYYYSVQFNGNIKTGKFILSK